MKIVSFVHFRCGSMTSSWPLFGVSFQIIVLLHLTYYKITHHHSWTKRFIPPNPTPPFCRGPRDPSMAFLARLSTPSSAIEAPKVASARPSTLPGGQPGSHSEMEWLGFGGKNEGVFFAFLLTGKYWAFFPPAHQEENLGFSFFLTVQVFPNTSPWRCTSYFLPWKWGYHIQLCLPDGISKDLPRGRLNSAIQWGSLVIHPLMFFLEYRHWSHSYVSPKRNDEKGNFHVYL